jgi:hypothetical protein
MRNASALIENDVKFDTISPLIFPLRAPFEKEIIISNESPNEDYSFFISAQPSELFYVTASSGLVNRETLFKALLNFTPPKTFTRAFKEVTGLVSLRNVKGAVVDQYIPFSLSTRD